MKPPAARLLAKFHPEAAIIAVSDSKHICQMIEGYMCNAFSVHSTEARGNGNHVRAAFDAGKKAGVMANGDTVVVVHTIRNEAGLKEVRPHPAPALPPPPNPQPPTLPYPHLTLDPALTPTPTLTH
jgi:hypothetical protein